ncbi:MAG TPA: DUF4159 domain-containing protein [Polyangiaceae bacterium]|jgi:hypothetical protein|nr:DUF4159 domain-containing protein [Polyangiaceae bacterium]
MPRPGFSRRAALGLPLSLWAGSAHAFGDAGAFHPRLLRAGAHPPLGVRESGAGRWSWELVRRTSAPARLVPAEVSADRPALQAEPFAVWAGTSDPGALSAAEVRGLTRFLRLGGVLVVDDSNPAVGAFGRGARRELSRVLPESAPVRLDPGHVVFKTFYIVDRPVGRVLGPPELEAIVRGKNAQVLFLQHDLLGALARSGEGFALETEPGGSEQREHAIRLAVNIAMYVLCSDYKDDQVHAPFLMRRRARQKP